MTLNATQFMKAAAVLCASLVCSQATIARDYANWMAELPDGLYVSQVSIPGTHDTATASLVTAAPTAQCQTASIKDQLNTGVRAFDFRPGKKPSSSSSEIYCYHGSARTSILFKDAISMITTFLEQHPTEFVIIHLDGGNYSSSITDAQYKAIFEDASIKPYMMNFSRNLTVKDMRKHIFIIKRYGLTLDAYYAPTAYEWYGDENWATLSDEERWRKQTGGKLESPNGNYRAALHVQDLANSNKASNGYDSKVEAVEQMLKHAQRLNATSDYSNIFVMNFCSGYNGTVSSSSSYVENATHTNKKVVDYLKEHSGPTGILMADYLVTDTHSGISGASGTYTTYGEQFIKSVVDNNFTYAAAYAAANAAKIPTFSQIVLPTGTSDALFRGNSVMIDVNKNGTFEIIAAGRDLKNGWANTITQISNLSTATQICQQNISYERQITPYDHNNDGHIDILMANSWASQLYLNDKAGAFTWLDAKDGEGNSRPLLYGQELGGQGDGVGENQRTGLCIPFDVDFNGYKDIVTYSGDKKPVVFENYNGTDAIYGKGACNIPQLTDGSMAEGDINNDGRPDLIITGKNASGVRQISFCIAKKGGWEMEVVTPESLQPYATTQGAIRLADINNDGLLDVFVTGLASDTQSRYNYNVAYLLINKGNYKFEKAPATFPGCKVSDIEFCDLDNDGLVDIIYLGEGPTYEDWLKVNGTDQNLYIAMNQGNGLFRLSESPFAGARSGASVAVADIDGDGLADVARMGYGSPCFAIFKNNGIPRASNAPHRVDFVNSYEDHDWGLHMGYDNDNNVYVRLDNPIENAGIRYNAFVVTKDSKQYSAVPANIEKKTLLTSNVDAATLNGGVDIYFPGVKYDNLASYGVQAILPNKKVIQIDNEDLIPTGIDGINLDENDADAPVEFYNLQGQRVVNPSNGIYIRRQGSNVTKVRI